MEVRSKVFGRGPPLIGFIRLSRHPNIGHNQIASACLKSAKLGSGIGIQPPRRLTGQEGTGSRAQADRYTPLSTFRLGKGNEAQRAVHDSNGDIAKNPGREERKPDNLHC
jgi:hypothetical protein